jgi:hypothetical protein
MNMVVYIYDVRAKGVLPAHPPEYSGFKNVLMQVFENQSIMSMVTILNSLVYPGDKIAFLYLCAHGNYGQMDLGLEGLNALTAWLLYPLQKVLAPNARILIHACGVASETPITKDGFFMTKTQPGNYTGSSTQGVGYQFLFNVAQATGAIVSGGVNVQQGDQRFNYEGLVLTVDPKGRQATQMGEG